ncbi:hypothetical protein [Streptomyces sp. NPDC051577]|uniref:hypothetical protein n=1 Tax=Streptomyces sp. NPDC051577 TaxID=3155166 RepID=UPI003423D11B
MRVRTTAAAFLGALALVLPASGQAMADDDYDGHHTLGRLYYVVGDEDGDEYTRHISPADNDTCYELTGTDRHRPATEAYNRTESLAVLFEGRGCNGRAVRTLAPGGGAHDVEALSVYFRPTGGDGHHGHHDGDWNDEDRRVRRDARPEQGAQPSLAKPAAATVAALAAPAPRPGDDEPADESADEQSREDEQRGEDEDQRGEDEQRDESGRPGDDQSEDENGQRGEDDQRGEDEQRDEDEARDEDGQRDERGQDGEEEEEFGVLDAVFRSIG